MAVVTNAEGTEGTKKTLLPFLIIFFPGNSKVYPSKNTKRQRQITGIPHVPTIHKSTPTVINNDFSYSDTQLEACSRLSAFSYFFLDF